jgi:hypothetical protein
MATITAILELMPTLNIEKTVSDALASLDILDVHTHLFAPQLGALGLWGIDELLTYH